RVVTANDADGKSHIMIDGGPTDEFRTGDLGGLLEIWHDDATGPLDPSPCEDKGAGTPSIMMCDLPSASFAVTTRLNPDSISSIFDILLPPRSSL
ncbi:MAG: hypothetical protein AAGK93_07590, partial [Pseudomonadota bacterium]